MHHHRYIAAKVIKKIDMAKKKRIILKYGYAKRLAAVCGVSRNTVSRALAWNSDCDGENLIRRKAEELGYIKQF